MKIFITGIAGFIGSNLADRLLKEGYAVVGIDNLSYGVEDQVPEGVEFHKADIRSRDIYPLFNGADYVFHLAATASLIDCHEDPVEAADVNVRGTVNVMESAKRAGVKKVIFAETSAVYEGASQYPTPESVEVTPKSIYSVSKLCASYFINAYSRFWGIPTTGLRYFNVYGPRQNYRRSIPPLMSAFIIKLLQNESPVIYGTGEKRRDYIHVDDVNAFHLQCLTDSRTDNRMFNLGTGKNYSVKEIYEMLRDILGKRLEPIYKPDFSFEALQNLADISAARALGWEPRIDIRDGLKEMIEYIKKEMEKGNVV